MQGWRSQHANQGTGVHVQTFKVRSPGADSMLWLAFHKLDEAWDDDKEQTMIDYFFM